jgi:hypothetical protein
MDAQPDSQHQPNASPKLRKHRRSKAQLLTRDALDQRTNAAKAFDRIAASIIADLGGAEVLTTVQHHLVEAFAGAAIQVDDLNTRLLMGQQVDILAHSQVISTLVRVASRIGIARVPRDVTPTISEYLPTEADA